MCGILGFIGDWNVDKEIALFTLAHRGPDDWGLWENSNKKVVLGHRRLSILDTTDCGRQPMITDDSRYAIIFNGEIYNFIEIRKKLVSYGWSFRSQSDTEVLLKAYIHWGPDCLLKFNGMWALAIWDDKKQELFLSRDRFGKKPLFYSEKNKALMFASEMKALFSGLGRVEANYDLVEKAKKDFFSYESTQECLIKGIKRFPAGHYGLYKGGELSLIRYWCTLDHLPEIPRRYEDQVEMFRELFLDACRLRMRSDVPIGTALSGGLDSSGTISSMAYLSKNTMDERASKDWQHAFVASFPGTPIDERCYAQKVVDHLGIKATYINIDPLKGIDSLYDYLYLFEEFYLTSPIPFMLTYKEVKDYGTSVTLDGHGADELYGGYDFDFIKALKDAGFNLTKINEILDTYYNSYPKDSAQFEKLPSKTRYLLTWHLKSFAKRILRRSPLTSQDMKHPIWKEMDYLTKNLYVSTHDTILPTLLRNYDRYSMANGVEIRMPFMDYRIVTFAFALPWTSKINNGFSKAIIRDALAPLMPYDIAYRKEKVGFNSPIVDWIKGPLKSFFLDVIESKAFRECNLINPLQTASVIRNVINDPCAKWGIAEQAWIMLTPFLWEQALNKGKKLSA